MTTEVAKAKKTEVQEAPVRSDQGSIISAILSAAKDSSIDINKLERLMSLRTELEADQRRIEFNAAMTAAQAEIEPVVRKKANEQTRSKYATLEAIHQMVVPVVTKHGFSMTFGTEDSKIEGHYRIVCQLSHRSGHSERYTADIPIDRAGLKGNDNKTATHAFGSTMSYGRRYLTLLIFNVATMDDNDGNRPKTNSTKPPPAKVVAAIKKCASVDSIDKLWKAMSKAERVSCRDIWIEQKSSIVNADKAAAGDAK